MEEALLAIARSAGDDLVVLSPSSERHFDPFSAVVAFAAMLAASYLRGLLGSFSQDAESLGERTGEQIKAALVRIFRGERDQSAAELEGLSTEVMAAMAQDPASTMQAADAARMRLVDALVKNGLPPDRALRLAAAVQRETLAAAAAA